MPKAYGHTWGIRPMRLMVERAATLGELWEHARLAPGRDVFLVLLHYLDYCGLGSGRLFQEWLFYAAVLKELHTAAPDTASKITVEWIGERVREGTKSSCRPIPDWSLGYEPLSERMPIAAVRKIMTEVDVHRSLDIA
jgi:hypothetical protein